ncbi:LegC family aminotransferase [Paracnuella aquatica]|uniref:LegC family aminotransferase n=1 Tax=Paracnuella aquatica TaxID=2268757 RepID=UPI000DEEF64E|nr:LegC family aminotransferase [Paracnuella aquatica]RPD45519.1 LegC family aminotransferase [Paracnuella aquatica]
MPSQYEPVVQKIRELFHQPEAFIPLHAPHFGGNEKKYVLDTIESTFVSSVGAYVTRFEEMMQEITGARFAVATTNGTTALHLALLVAGVQWGDEVITQPLTFVATANAVRHAGAQPVFVDVDPDTMGLSPAALEAFLEENVVINESGQCINKQSGRRIAACLPMHTFGFPLRIEAIDKICQRYGIILVEDAAESLGSYVGRQHTGRFGKLGTFSFNGNKTVTCGGGGALITDDEALAQKAKHLSTTAKQPHAWEFYHDEVAYNYRLPNLNAALACAQLEQLDKILANKRELSHDYKDFFTDREEQFIREAEGTTANYWLNTIILKDRAARDQFLEYTNAQKVMTRPIWRLMNDLPMYASCMKGDLSNARWLEERVVNIPSSYRPNIQ